MLTQSVIGAPSSLGLVFLGVVGVLSRDESEVSVAGEISGQAGAAPLLIHHCLELVALVSWDLKNFILT